MATLRVPAARPERGWEHRQPGEAHPGPSRGSASHGPARPFPQPLPSTRVVAAVVAKRRALACFFCAERPPRQTESSTFGALRTFFPARSSARPPRNEPCAANKSLALRPSHLRSCGAKFELRRVASGDRTLLRESASRGCASLAPLSSPVPEHRACPRWLPSPPMRAFA